MSRNRKPNRVHVRYDRAELEAVFTEDGTVGPKRLAALLDEYERVRAEGKDRPCQSEVYHGPGHQSATYCQATGDHERHEALLPSGGYADWSDDDPYAEYWG